MQVREKFGAIKRGHKLPRRAGFVLGLAIFFLAVAFPARAQQAPQDPQTNEEKTTQAPQDPQLKEEKASQAPDSSATNPSQAPDETPIDSLPRPVTTSLETGQAISVDSGAVPALKEGAVAALLHKGHLNILSISTFYEYDSNFTFSPTPQASNAVALEALVFYSIGGPKTALDLQYRPYILASQGDVQADFIANSLDLHTFHYLNEHWLLDINDRFQYLPARGRLIDPTVSPDPGSGVLTRGPFLSNDETTLSNALLVSAQGKISDRDTLTIHGQFQYVEDWIPPNTLNPGVTTTQFQRESTIGGGASWSRLIHKDQHFGVSYNYDRQVIGNIKGQYQYDSVMIDYSQRFHGTLVVQASFGPAWQIPGGGGKVANTYVGAASILKSFRRATLALSFARNEDYVGVIANGFYTRYDSDFSYFLSRRWEVGLGAGYLQQGYATLSSFNSRIFWGRLSYQWNEKFGVFASLTNETGAGGIFPYATRYLASVGLRWGYQRNAAEGRY